MVFFRPGRMGAAGKGRRCQTKGFVAADTFRFMDVIRKANVSPHRGRMTLRTPMAYAALKPLDSGTSAFYAPLRIGEVF